MNSITKMTNFVSYKSLILTIRAMQYTDLSHITHTSCKNLLLFIIFQISFVVKAVADIPFVPIVTAYKTSDYKAGIQNWAIAQDRNGIMYFGNNKGLLEFDGNFWKLHELPNKGIVRSIYLDKNRIYIGSFEEFGYFAPDNRNRLTYHSLKDSVRNYTFHNDEIWTIVKWNNQIFFHSFGSLFVYDQTNVTQIPLSALPLNLFPIGNSCYSQQIKGNLCEFNGKEFTELITRKQLKGCSIVAGVPHKNGILFFTNNAGGFVWKNSQLKEWHTDCDEDFKKYTINHAIMTKDSCYIIGTLSNGLYALDKNGKKLWVENARVNLHNNTVLGLYCDKDNNIWAALDDGIVYIQSNSLISYYKPPLPNIGMIYDVSVQKEGTYIASNQGLYLFNKNQLQQVRKMEEQTWYIKRIGEQTFCGHNKGTFLISGLDAFPVSEAQGGMCLKELKIGEKSYLIGGTYGGIDLYQEASNGQYKYLHQLKGFHHLAASIETDSEGYIWVKHLRKGIYRLQLDKDMQNLKVTKEINRLGNIENGNYCLGKINGEIVMTNGTAFYKYVPSSDSIVPHTALNRQANILEGIHSIRHAYNNVYWFAGTRKAYKVLCNQDSYKIQEIIPYSMFNEQNMEERSNIICDRGGQHAYLCLNNQLVRITTDSTILYTNPVKPQLRIADMHALNESNDSTVLLLPNADNKIAYTYNTIRFRLSYPAYSDHNYGIRYQLEGLSEQWTEGERDLQKTYSRLPAGTYRFKAEIYNHNQVLATTQVSFSILPPWYLNSWAIVIYILTGILTVGGLQYWAYTYVKKKKDKVLEQERMAHQAAMQQQENRIIKLEKEQLEADLRFKSKELSGVVMTNIAHQEFLTSLEKEIQQLKITEKSVNRCMDKLLMLIHNNMVSDEESWQTFLSNFDRIHENFFRTLKDKYPELTPNDLRFCALLRLNMPTKEIAQFLNISVRGVETARYRLRKKLHLAQEESLTEFMIELK